MALSASKLEISLAQLLDPTNPLFAGFPATPSIAAANFASVYASYTASSTDAGNNTLATSSEIGFATALSTVTNMGNPGSCAAAFGSAFTAFWTGATFRALTPPPSGVGGTGLFGSVASSVVAAAPGTSLQAALAALFSVNSSSGAMQANLLATAFHTATTHSVVVVITGLDTTPAISGGPLPIVNTGVVS